MEHKITKLPKSEIEILATIPFSEFEPHLKKAAVLISEKTEIPGFRKGKAPYEIVQKRMGEMAIYEKAADLVIRQNYRETLERAAEEFKKEQKEFLPIGRPEVIITKLAPGNDLEYKVTLTLLPEVKLPNYKSIARSVKKEKKGILVSEEEIQKTIDWIRESRAPLITVDRAAQKGDLTEVDFEIKQDGVKIEGGDSKNHPLTIGQGKFLPGFEEQLTGMKSGEEKTFTLVVPENWHDKILAGKKLAFKVAVRLVQEKRTPELNDEFAKSLGAFSSVEALKNNIREGLIQEKTEKEKQRIRVLTIDGVADAAKTEIPEVLVLAELKKMRQELKSGIEQNLQMRWEDYLLHLKKTEEELTKEWRSEAEKRVKIALCLREIANLEKIEPADEEIKIAADQHLAQFETTEEIKKKIDRDDLKEYTKGILRNERVFEFLEGLT